MGAGSGARTVQADTRASTGREAGLPYTTRRATATTYVRTGTLEQIDISSSNPAHTISEKYSIATHILFLTTTLASCRPP